MKEPPSFMLPALFWLGRLYSSVAFPFLNDKDLHHPSELVSTAAIRKMKAPLLNVPQEMKCGTLPRYSPLPDLKWLISISL